MSKNPISLLTAQKTGIDKLILFTGTIFILLGIYAILRVSINFWVYPTKYPTTGIFNSGYYGQREEDCYFQMGSYLNEKGQVRPANPEEKILENDNKNRCLSGIVEARKTSKVNDLSSIGLFLLLGSGILISKQWLIK